MAYKSKIRFSAKKNNFSRLNSLSKSKKPLKNTSWKNRWDKFKSSKKKRHRFKEFFWKFAGVFILIGIIVLIWGISYIQSISEDLPNKDEPFGKNKGNASYIYDRNGKELYKMFADENHDPVNINEVPELLKWSYLAAEDINFYQHNGIDLKAIARCAYRNIIKGEVACGASTITQQIVKQTALTSEQKYERKIKEIILSLQIEKVRTKDEILQIYLTISPEGSNVYGVKTAAQFYYGKKLEELNLAEMAILASIPQNPTFLSPTKSANTELSQKDVKKRQEYVLDQMEKNINLINKTYKEQKNTDKDLVTKEQIEEARNFVLVYREPRFEIKAPHFVFYAKQQLEYNNYNNGVPFTATELETGGYKITTTLDLDFQALAEQQVKVGVNDYGKKYGGENAALIAMNPRTGEIYSMAGSYDYFGKPSPEGCIQGKNCRFEPHVNITNSLQSPGSSMKPMVYYMGIMNGLITPGSLLPDIPIQILNYKPKNFEGGFNGINTARYQLSQSRNIPAIYLVNQMGIQPFVDEMNKWGYSTLNNPQGYGPSISVGGSDIKLIDHATAYSVLANEGKYTAKETILKIEDADGKIIYEHKPVSEQVADPRGVYLINHILNGNNGGPPSKRKWDGRDVAGKTGTSEEQREVLYATYTPEIVVVGWLGNNDNTSLRDGVSGFGTALPWIADYMKLIGASFPGTAFPRPAGIANQSICSVSEELAANPDAQSLCDEFKGDLSVADIKAPASVVVSTVQVCTDQPTKLARDIDIAMGLTQSLTVKYYKMVDPNMQKFLDEYFASKPELGKNGPPTEYCDINRNPDGQTKPWAVITKPVATQPLGKSLDVEISAFSPNGKVSKIEVYIDAKLLGESVVLPYTKTFDMTSYALTPGQHIFSVKVFDATGADGTTSVKLEVLGDLTFTIPATIPAGTTQSIIFAYTGSGVNNVVFNISNGEKINCTTTKCTWKPTAPATLDIWLTATSKGIPVESKKQSIVIN